MDGAGYYYRFSLPEMPPRRRRSSVGAKQDEEMKAVPSTPAKFPSSAAGLASPGLVASEASGIDENDVLSQEISQLLTQSDAAPAAAPSENMDNKHSRPSRGKNAAGPGFVPATSIAGLIQQVFLLVLFLFMS